MSLLTYIELKTNLSMLQKITEFKYSHEFNEHALFELKGIIDEEDKDKCIKRLNEQSEIEIFNEKETIFKGLIRQIEVELQGGIYYLKLEGISFSFLTDIKKKRRSFQNKNGTYESIMKQIASQYANSYVIDNASKGCKTNQIVVQYEESDWEFLKRLASHFNKPLLPVIHMSGPKLIVGVPNNGSKGNIEKYDYHIQKDLEKSLNLKENDNIEFIEDDKICFFINTTDDYEVGDKVSYQTKSLIVMKKEAEMKQGIMNYQYYLTTKQGCSVHKTYNKKLAGASIKGKVLKIVNDKVKVKLEIDDSQEEATAWEFPYTTLYTAEGNSGWYCMPEVGDTVYIYFADQEESNAVGLNTVRSGQSTGDKTDNPAIKYFRTADGKEIKFSDDEILITCVDGMDPKTGEKKTIYIKLNKDSGVEIKSTEPISFKSDKGITIEAEEKIEFKASDEIKFHCKNSEIKMDTKIEICGPDVRIN